VCVSLVVNVRNLYFSLTRTIDLPPPSPIDFLFAYGIAWAVVEHFRSPFVVVTFVFSGRAITFCQASLY